MEIAFITQIAHSLFTHSLSLTHQTVEVSSNRYFDLVYESLIKVGLTIGGVRSISEIPLFFISDFTSLKMNSW